MSGFKTHLYGGMAAGVTTSAFLFFKYPSMFEPTKLLGIFLTGTIGGLLPDLDSDTSKPFSIFFTLLSMVVPILFFKEISAIWLYLIPYIQNCFVYISKIISFTLSFLPSKLNLIINQFYNSLNPLPIKVNHFPNIEELTPEFIITYFVISFIFIKYGLCTLVKKITVHRGIMHSIPFALLCSELGFFIFIPSGKNMAIAVGISIFIGFLTHLLIDEANSITLKYGFIPKFKKSAGTAFKFRSRSITDTIIVYFLILSGGIKIIQLIGLSNKL
ncbi:MAG: metal-dependent hydrolase [Desulfamplus sp.]|nr:metal-dependent hydrolase [Desulfamplus sp.]